MRILLIRHGMTEGNRNSRYIGITDEPLCPQGRVQLSGRRYPLPQVVYASPLLRCRQTAEILYPHMEPRIAARLAECNFGDFENKNWKELSGDPRYQQWIDSGGTLAFPGGESPEEFKKRSVDGFEEAVGQCLAMKIDTVAFVVHGGTIMSILERFATPSGDYYSWSVKNGEGYEARLDSDLWSAGIKQLTNIQKLEVTGEEQEKLQQSSLDPSRRGREHV